MNSMTRKSNSYYNTCKRSTKSIRNSFLFRRNISTRSSNKKILNSWEIKLEFCNSLKTVSIKTKTKRARCRLKAASNRSMTKSTKMKTSSSLSLKSRWCCSSNRPVEVVKNQKNLNSSPQNQSYKPKALYFTLLPLKSKFRFSKRRRKWVLRRWGDSTKPSIRFNSSCRQVPKTWIHNFCRNYCSNNRTPISTARLQK